MATTAGMIGGVGDLFGGIATFAGSMSEAKAYKQAAKYAEQNAVISQMAGDIKLAQTSRQIFKVLGTQAAGYAGAGLTNEGSAQAVMRSSVSQGALEKAIVNAQTAINVIGYKSQAAQFKGMAAASKAAGAGGLIAGIAGFGAALALSDDRLKTDVERIGSHGNLNIYRFRFFGEDRLRVGVKASEVAVHAPHALGPLADGHMTVDYGKLGLAHLLEYEAVP